MLKTTISRDKIQFRKGFLLTALMCLLLLALVAGASSQTHYQAGVATLIFVVAAAVVFLVPRGRATESPLLWLPSILLAFGGLCFLQLISLPCEALLVIAPLSVDYYALLADATASSCMASVSVDRPHTLQTGLWWIALAVWAWMLITVTHANRSRHQRLGIILLIIAVSQAAYGLLMQLSGIEYGAFFEAKTYYRGHATGTLVNRNHFAALMYIAMSLALPALLEQGESGKGVGALNRFINWATSPKILVRMTIVVFAIAAVNSHSRMGNVALALGLSVACLLGFICALLPKLSKGLASARYFIFLTLSVAAVDLVVVSNWFGLEQVVNRIENTTAATEERDEIVTDVLESGWITGAAVAGTGAGSFEAVYRQYESVPRLRRVDHAHNDWLQFWLEYGAAGSALVLIGLVLLGWRLVNIPRAQAIAVLSLLAMLAAHALVDFALRMPAVGLFVVAGLVYLLTETTARNKRRRVRRAS
jgi:O-antigen ligase